MGKMFFKVILLWIFLLPLFGVEVDAQSFAIQRVGNGKQAVIFIPGFACSGDVWKQTVDALKEDYTCYVLTMPGFAGVAPEENPSFESWTKQIMDFIRKEDIRKPILVGHSMGGGMALAIASADAELVKSIVVVDALPCLAAIYNPDFQSRKITEKEFVEVEKRFMSMSDEQFGRQQYLAVLSLTTDSLRYDPLVQWGLLSDRKTYAKMYYDYSNIDLRSAIKQISVPTMVLLESSFKKIAPMVERQFGNVSTFKIGYAEKGLHFIMYDDWEWYIQQLIEFLNEQS